MKYKENIECQLRSGKVWVAWNGLVAMMGEEGKNKMLYRRKLYILIMT